MAAPVRIRRRLLLGFPFIKCGVADKAAGERHYPSIRSSAQESGDIRVERNPPLARGPPQRLYRTDSRVRPPIDSGSSRNRDERRPAAAGRHHGPSPSRREFTAILILHRSGTILAGSDSAFRHQFGESLKRPVVRFLGVLREATPGQLPAPQMVPDAFAAQPLAAAGRIRAGTALQVLFLIAFHSLSPGEAPSSPHAPMRILADGDQSPGISIAPKGEPTDE
jgi:hypothetical protein